MSKPVASASAPMSSYLQQALREKAERDLASIDQRIAAFDAVDRALDALVTLSTELGQSTPAIAQAAPDATIAAKLKKLRRSIDDARGLAQEIAQTLDAKAQRDEAATARTAILEALAAAGIDPATLSAGGEAE